MTRLYGVRAQITKWVSDDQPGFVEVRLEDAEGMVHHFVDKVPVVSLDDLTAESAYPIEIWIAVKLIEARSDGTLLVDLSPWGIELEGGLTQLRVAVGQLRAQHAH